MTDNASPAVQAFADGIATASGGTIQAGMAYGWTSRLGTEALSYELSHRDGTGLDLDLLGADLDTVCAWLSTLDCVDEVVPLGESVHITLNDKTVDLAGCPKPKKKKADPVEEPVAE